MPAVPPPLLRSLTRAAARGLRPDAFGADPAGERLRRIRRSPQFRDGAFRNETTVGTAPEGPTRDLLREMFRSPERPHRRPAAPLPLHRPDLSAPPASGLRLTWLGHATVLAEIDGHRVLFDPVWGERCSPFRFAGPRRFHPVPVPLSALGPLDAVVISHDHYDHLDMPTVRALRTSGAPLLVPLGVGAHLEHWGVPPSRIVELDWHQTHRVGGLACTATPGQHFCGRGLRRRSLTLWASWVVAGPEHRVFHSGDTGYFPGFARIGAEHGPFDAAMMQIGAYSDYWPDIHMTPEEGLRAHRDLSGGVLLPIHWGTFNLALHPWAEPVEWITDIAGEAGQPIAVPRPGEPFEPTAGPLPADPWWRSASRPVTRHWRRRAPARRPAGPAESSPASAPGD